MPIEVAILGPLVYLALLFGLWRYVLPRKAKRLKTTEQAVYDEQFSNMMQAELERDPAFAKAVKRYPR